MVLKNGSTPGPYATLELAKKAGVFVWPWGIFVNEVVSFAFAIFLVVKAVNNLRHKEVKTPPQRPNP